jgi:hypothetical protein
MNEQINIDLARHLAPSFLEDYFDKRAALYQRAFNLPFQPARQDEFDANSHFVLATDAEECLGGLRATVRHPGTNPTRLPLEKNCQGLRLQEIFPDLHLDRTSHAELSKLIVHSGRARLGPSNDVMERLLKFALITHNPEPSVKYAFIFAPRVRMRMYTMQARWMGVQFETRQVPDEFTPPELRPFGPTFIQACYLASLN